MGRAWDHSVSSQTGRRTSPSERPGCENDSNDGGTWGKGRRPFPQCNYQTSRPRVCLHFLFQSLSQICEVYTANIPIKKKLAGFTGVTGGNIEMLAWSHRFFTLAPPVLAPPTTSHHHPQTPCFRDLENDVSLRSGSEQSLPEEGSGSISFRD